MRDSTAATASSRNGARARLAGLLTGRWDLLRDYLSAISGSAGRLVFSLIYFIALANTLSIADFGRFATASAAGVMLSRILAFGFVSTLYRVAAVKPRLLGVYTAGFLVLGLVSLPALAVAAWLTHGLVFAGELAWQQFAVILVGEALLWRLMEVVVIVNNGLGRFARGALLVILGTLVRSLAAVVFAWWPHPDLASWSVFYLIANAAAMLMAIGFFFPRHRLRLAMPLYWRRLPDALSVAGAELLFYLQMEMDKLLVLAAGGPHLAGLYAIIMRLVDLTAIPIRSFTMILVQKLMRTPGALDRLRLRVGLETAVFAVSTLSLMSLALVLHVFPSALGRTVAEASPLVALAVLVPGLRNLVEYHAELLFARGRTFIRALNLAFLAGVKAALLYWAIVALATPEALIKSLNGLFAVLYVLSAVVTYCMLRLPAKKI